MGKVLHVILKKEDRRILESWTSKGKTEKRLAERARIILLSEEYKSRTHIASYIGITPYVVTRWRKRFIELGISGLFDKQRSGKPPVYGKETERRILSVLDESPPKGFSRWNGQLIANRLGTVSTDYVWRVMRKYGIELERRHSWCISTDPEFTQKAADIIGLYLSPPEGAFVLCVDEKPCIQALERAQGYLRMPNGKTLTGFAHEYKRHGTTTLFAALDVMTGTVAAMHAKRKRRREFLDFMNDVLNDVPNTKEVHVILDNLKTHKPKIDRWLSRHKNVRFHYSPTHASWMNMVEIWFSILQTQSLRGARFTSVQQLRNHIDTFIEAYTNNAHPFEWRKLKVKNKEFETKYSDLCN